MLPLYIFGGIFLFLFSLFYLISLTYPSEKKTGNKAKEEAFLKKFSESEAKSKVDVAPNSDEPSSKNPELERCKKEIEKLNNDIKEKNKIIDDLRNKLFDYEHAKKTKEQLNSNNLDSLINRNHELSLEKDELDAENFSLQLQLSEKEALLEKLLKEDRDSVVYGYSAADITYMLERLHDLENLEAHLDHAAISASRSGTWGNMKGKRYKTLTPAQQSQIHFPILDPDCVYFLPSHSSFHSVYWCYSLDNSPPPSRTTLDNAIEQSYKPCSKCVDPDTYNDYLTRTKLSQKLS